MVGTLRDYKRDNKFSPKSGEKFVHEIIVFQGNQTVDFTLCVKNSEYLF